MFKHVFIDMLKEKPVSCYFAIINFDIRFFSFYYLGRVMQHYVKRLFIKKKMWLGIYKSWWLVIHFKLSIIRTQAMKRIPTQNKKS